VSILNAAHYVHGTRVYSTLDIGRLRMIQDFLVVGSNSTLLLRVLLLFFHSVSNLKDDSKGKLLLKMQIKYTVSSGVPFSL
jgi:hypothetical protein